MIHIDERKIVNSKTALIELQVELQELEGMADPTRKEIESTRKRIDSVNRQLKPLGQSCIKKVKKKSNNELSNIKVIFFFKKITLLINDFKPLIV